MRHCLFLCLPACLLSLLCSCNKSYEITNLASLDCLPTGLRPGVVAFYAFGNGSLKDYSGNNYNLSNNTTAAPTADRAGNAKCAFSFDRNSNEFLQYTNPAFADNFPTQPFSISLWYRNTTQRTAMGLGYELLIGRDSLYRGNDTYGQWSVGLFDLKKPVFGINGNVIWWPDETITDSLSWKHYVVTCQGSDLKLYINGTLSSASTGTAVNGRLSQNVGDLLIGKDYSGYIDDIIIYNRVLTPFEINELFNTPACCE